MPETDKTTPQRTRRRGQHMTDEERKQAQDVFIKALGNTANVRVACMQAGVDHSTVYRWQEHDEEFSIRFKQANHDANWILFGEAWRRAIQGDEEYVVSHGKIVYGLDGKPLVNRKKSDRLLELLLKARLPEFRDKQSIDVNTNINKDVQALHKAIEEALDQHPEAKIALAEKLAEIDGQSR